MIFLIFLLLVPAIAAVIAFRTSYYGDEAPNAVGAGFLSMALGTMLFSLISYPSLLSDNVVNTESEKILPFEDGSYVHIQFTEDGQYASYNLDVGGQAIVKSFPVVLDDAFVGQEFYIQVDNSKSPSLETYQEIVDPGLWYPFPLFGEITYGIRIPQDAILLVK